MAGEAESMDEIIANDGMRVLVQGGPRHFVRATIHGDPESWMVDHQAYMVRNNDVVGFVHDADADHFISQGRAESLGRWNSLDELSQAWAAHNQAQQPAEQKHKGKRRG